jgi:hypothetical protein
VSENPYRLPRHVIPSRYDLRLEPDLAAATFAGEETITVEVVTPTAEVVLNSIEIEIDEATVQVGDGEPMAATVALDAKSERATLTFPSELPAGPASLHLRFRGILNDKLVGFYRSTFSDESGAERVLATTQMEATDARRAFPCWDEPDAKAVFGVTLVVPEDLLAVSNAGEIGREPAGEGKVAVRFADTMPMSTYLVAFVVGPLVASAPVDVDGKPLRIVHPPGKEHLATFAQEVGAFALRFFTDWFGMAYPGRQARPRGHPRLRLRGHGEPGLRHLPGAARAGRPRARHPGRAADRGGRHRPRDRPHVVRRPRDHEVVERDLAQRGVRHVHGDDLHRRLPARVAALGRLRAGPLGRVRHRRPGLHPDRSSTRSSPPRMPTACSTC